MDWTDTHYRHLARLLSRNTWLYTEMVVDKTLIHNPDNLERWLEYSTGQNPVVLQLGGSDPETLSAAARIARPFNYDEINLNCGCPSTLALRPTCGARPGDPKTRRPGDQETRRPGDPETRRPGLL
eukprot:9501375-Pyramimonas_sp.AAC.4